VLSGIINHCAFRESFFYSADRIIRGIAEMDCLNIFKPRNY